MVPPIEFVLFLMLLAMAVFIARAHSLFTAVMLSGIFSLLCTGIYTLADAVDVAFTEAAVGAGISTVLFLATLALTGDAEAPRKQPSKLALLIVAFAGCALLYGTADMPAYGDYAAPIHHHVVPRYITESAREVGMPNIVTSVLASYRGFDTLGETTVVFTACVGVLVLLRAHLKPPTRRAAIVLPDRGFGGSGSPPTPASNLQDPSSRIGRAKAEPRPEAEA